MTSCMAEMTKTGQFNILKHYRPFCLTLWRHSFERLDSKQIWPLVQLDKYLEVYLINRLTEQLDWTNTTDALYMKDQNVLFYQTVVARVLFYPVVHWKVSVTAGGVDQLINIQEDQRHQKLREEVTMKRMVAVFVEHFEQFCPSPLLLYIQ